VHHLALVTDAGYLPWAATAIRSVLDTQPAGSTTVHLVHDGSVEPDDLERVAAMVGTAAVLVEHRVAAADVAHLPAVAHFGTVVWLRFLLPTLLSEVDRVVYLDADTLVVDDLAPLFATDLGGRPIGAVANLVAPSQWRRITGLGILDPADVCNSGVLLMDLAALRRLPLPELVEDTVRALGDRLTWPDQDVLNVLFAGSWTPLHPRYNLQTSCYEWLDLAVAVHGEDVVRAAHAQPAVVHFEGPAVCKPWSALCTHPLRAQYLEVLRRTPWPDAATEVDRLALATGRLPAGARRRALRQLAGWRTDRRAHLRRSLDAGARRLRLAPPAPAVTSAAVRPTRCEPHVLSTASDAHRRIVARCRPHTMVSAERLLAVIDATEHVVRQQVPGALVECGVWRGGSVLAMALTLLDLGVTDRPLHLFDTFEGMTEPTADDTSAFHDDATVEWRRARADGGVAYAEVFDPSIYGLGQVRRLLHASGYPPELVTCTVGPVEATLPAAAPPEVALLRLDTDWYESTRHELEHLYPRLARQGILIVDDYGHWDGAHKATEEYFSVVPRPLLLRTDYTGRIGVKP
jgi:O-methyltransferase